jgi:hypothetical protein
MAKHPTQIEPLAVGTRGAGRMGGWGKTKTFELIAAGELESYLDGSKRMVTTASIRARIERKLKEGPSKRHDGQNLTNRAAT